MAIHVKITKYTYVYNKLELPSYNQITCKKIIQDSVLQDYSILIIFPLSLESWSKNPNGGN